MIKQNSNNQKATIVVDLGFGDSGKGGVVDYLVRKRGAKTVVRFNGGPQAAHNVLTEDGHQHTFSQFGSGSLVAGTKTFIAKFVLVNPLNLVAEAEHLGQLGVDDPLQRLSIDRQAMLITPMHRTANRIRELQRGANRHGSCGQGVGEAMRHRIKFPGEEILAFDLGDEVKLRSKMRALQYRLRDEFEGQAKVAKIQGWEKEWGELLDPLISAQGAEQYFAIGKNLDLVEGDDYLAGALSQGEVVFEGSQGVLIDEWHGFHPYTTWSTCTPRNAMSLLRGVGYRGEVTKLGLIRGYATRHGAGPFVTEDETLSRLMPDRENKRGRWQGEFRVGQADMVTTRYAVAVSGGIDQLGVTNLDRMGTPEHRGLWRVCDSYRYRGRSEITDIAIRGSGGEVVGLRPKAELEDLGYQVRLTDLVSNANPIYLAAKGVEDNHGLGYALDLAGRTGIRLGLWSFGPTAREKREIELK